MKSVRRHTIHDRLSIDIALAENAKTTEDRKALAYQAIGAAEIAVEFDLITYMEFEGYINSIFSIL